MEDLLKTEKFGHLVGVLDEVLVTEGISINIRRSILSSFMVQLAAMHSEKRA